MAKKVKKTGDKLIKSTPEAFVVRGQIRQTDGSLLVGAIVRAFDRDLRSEQLLGETTTDKDGRYEITYTANKFRRAEKKSADVIVRVFSKKGQELVSSKIIFNAKPVETVDLVIGGGEYRRPSEYERLVAELTPVLQGIPLADLKEDTDHQDFTFLTGETGENRQHIEFLALAARLGKETELPPEVFYGLFRQNLPTKLSALLSQHPQVLRHALEVALRDNIIPARLNGQIDTILERLKQLIVKRTLQPQDAEGKTTLGALLGTILSSNLQKKFVQLYVWHQGPKEEFWKKLREDEDFKEGSLVDDLQLTLQLGTLTQNHLPMVRALQKQGPDGKLKSLRDLADLDEEGWTELIKKVGGKPIGFPPGTPGKDDAEKISNYAKSIERTIEDAFPTAVFAARYKRKGIPGTEDVKADIDTFFVNNPDFDFRTTYIEKYFADKQSLNALPNKDVLKSHLKKAQRIFKLTPRFEEIRDLLADGLDSALSITLMGRRNFIKRHSNPNPNPDMVYDIANNRTAITTTLLAEHSPVANRFYDFPWLAKRPKEVAGFPDWASLFGSLSFCECEHCRSVYSPAAYLVDLLDFLKKNHLKPAESQDEDEISALDVLFQRRPDIGEIELSCENTNTPVPYVDLVNEILENAISPRNEDNSWPQTTWTAEELSANPEHVNTAAYEEILRNAVYPWNLPLNLWVEESRLYLEHLGVQRFELMETFQRQGDPPSPSDLEIAAEYLRLTTTDREIITGPNPTPAKKRGFWGFRDATWVTALRVVPEFLHRSQLSYKQLLELLDTTFIHPDGNIEIEFRGSGCNIEKATFNDNLDSNALTRIHRFLRLWRKLGWTMHDLDRAIVTLNRETLDNDLLLKVSHIQRLCTRLKVSVQTALSWYALIDTAPYDDLIDRTPKSLYEQLFQNPAVVKLNPGEADPFELNEDRTELSEVGVLTIADDDPDDVKKHKQRILRTLLGAFGLSDTDLTLLITSPQAVVTAGKELNLENLSRLYRTISLARALKLSVQGFLQLKDLSGIYPFVDDDRPVATEDTRNTLRFVETVEKARTSDFSPAELDYLLRHQFVQSSGLAPTEEGIGLILNEIRSGLQKIFAETMLTPDPSGELMAKKLEVLKWEGDLVRQVVDLLNGSVTYRAALPALPPQVQPFPAEIKITFNSDARELRFVGAMTTGERETLLNLADDPDYRAAIRQLFGAPRNFVTEQMKTFVAPTHEARLDVQPPAFPLELSGKISYDSDAQVLRFLGTMTEQEKTALDALSDDPAYRRAVEQLFAAPLSFVPPENNRFLTADDATQLFDLTRPAQEKFEYVVTRVDQYLRRTLSESLIKQKLSEALNLNAATMEQLLTRWQDSAVDSSHRAMTVFRDQSFVETQDKMTAARFPEQFATFTRLHKVTAIISRLKITSQELPWLFEHSPELGWLNFNTLPTDPDQPAASFIAWENLVEAFQLRDGWPAGKPALFEILDQAIGFTATGDANAANAAKAELLDRLSASTGWRLEDLETLVGQKNQAAAKGALNFTFPIQPDDANDYKDAVKLVRLKSCFAMMKRLGVSAEQCQRWANPDPIADDAISAKQAVKAKYDNRQWLTVAKPLSDILREKKRAALVSYLTGHPDAVPGKTFYDANELFSHFLIDVEMSPCMMTSRIKQAIGSVQLFIQRCLMNLELEEAGSPVPEENWAKDWKWMKSYRVWEANRKVFLYAENWIELELRDDKSPFFKDLENELLQNEMTSDTAETAFLNYLEKLDAVARLDIVGMYHQVEDGLDILHVFGRTQGGDPHIYYYRQRVDAAYWTPWERVDLDIQGNHLIPVVWNRRLYLFWPIFTERAVTQESIAEEQQGQAPLKFWEIQLAWSDYNNKKWSAKKVSKEKVTRDFNTNPMQIPTYEKTGFFFDARIELNELVITCKYACRSEGDWWTFKIGSFTFMKCHGNITVKDLHDSDDLLLPLTSHIEFMTFTEDPDEDRLLLVSGEVDISRNFISNTQQYILTLNKTPNTYSILYPHQFRHFVSQAPFFYQDDARTFFVTRQDMVMEIRRVFPIDPFGNVPPIEGEALRWLVKYYLFETFYHPYVCEFIKQLNRYGIDGLLNPAPNGEVPELRRQQISDKDFFADVYGGPDGLPDVVDQRYPVEEVDVSPSGAYSLYNWELFFHAPLLLADRLSKNQRFEESQRWFHYIFDPTDASGESGPKRFWKFRKFYDDATLDADGRPRPIQQLLELLQYDGSDPDIRKEKEEMEKQVEQWRLNPFNPHLIARLRTSVYQKTVVMKYIDNLISWGDQLFRRDTIESINEATLLYILAAEILGKRPERIPARTHQEKTFNQLLDEGLDAFSNALVEIENFLPADDHAGNGREADEEALLPSGQMLYFCVPPNDKLFGYWDMVADRLFKIRHCMTIEGVVRQLPLFEPPIEPGLLVRAAAMGVDISSALNDINAALPHYRFSVMLQKTTELCNDVKSLGTSLLLALEKKDAEELSLLRSSHEIRLLEDIRYIKEQQVEEAQRTKEGLEKSLEAADSRYKFYKNVQFMNEEEKIHLMLMGISAGLQLIGQVMEIGAGGAHNIPDVTVGVSGWAGSPVTVVKYGGSNVGSGLEAWAKAFLGLASLTNTGAVMASTLGSYRRRQDEWNLQEDLAAKEKDQIDKQIAAAEIRKAIAEKDLENHDKQIENAKAVDEYMRSKFTNQELYNWMVGQISSIYFQSYQLAYDVAKRVERAYRHELGLEDSGFIQFGYWDSLKKGLLAGEKLYFDLKRMEMAYLDRNKREYEITKHISLVMLDPIALVKLKETGECFVNLPEALFDLDYAGHYMRRIKSVSLTIPCVTGPYTSVNCTLTLLKNSCRVNNTLLNGSQYDRDEDRDDPRFRDNLGAIQSIATSSGQNDSGVFELNFRDERYLPFEGAGAISEWRIEFPKDFRQFDYDTISDVVLHLRYTAREGGGPLKQQATTELQTALNEFMRSEGQRGLARPFTLRHEFSSAWHRFLNPPTGSAGDQTLTMALTKDHFPFLFQDKTITINTIELFVKVKPEFASTLRLSLEAGTAASNNPMNLVPWNGLFHAVQSPVGSLGDWTLTAWVDTDDGAHGRMDPNAIQDILVVCQYTWL